MTLTETQKTHTAESQSTMRVTYDPKTQRVPIKAWLPDIEPGALEQALNLARLPFAFKHIALMPDVHQATACPSVAFLPRRGTSSPTPWA
jgi:hypothetical protein